MILRHFWVNRKGRYPFVSRETWVMRYWLLRRKISSQHGIMTDADRRVSAEIIRLSPPSAPRHLLDDLQELIFNGTDPYPYDQDAPQEEGLGS